MDLVRFPSARFGRCFEDAVDAYTLGDGSVMSSLRSGRAVTAEKFNYFTSVTKAIHTLLDSSISKLYPQGMGVYARKDDLLQQGEYYPEAAKEVALKWQKHRCSVLKPKFHADDEESFCLQKGIGFAQGCCWDTAKSDGKGGCVNCVIER